MPTRVGSPPTGHPLGPRFADDRPTVPTSGLGRVGHWLGRQLRRRGAGNRPRTSWAGRTLKKSQAFPSLRAPFRPPRARGSAHLPGLGTTACASPARFRGALRRPRATPPSRARAPFAARNQQIHKLARARRSSGPDARLSRGPGTPGRPSYPPDGTRGTKRPGRAFVGGDGGDSPRTSWAPASSRRLSSGQGLDQASLSENRAPSGASQAPDRSSRRLSSEATRARTLAPGR